MQELQGITVLQISHVCSKSVVASKIVATREPMAIHARGSVTQLVNAGYFIRGVIAYNNRSRNWWIGVVA